ncbi:MAG: matrixin family metalloprotease, partial [Planctomycetales bacterium]|nr:matrixin family metalloprotease [Planctomycetales bacterium]
LDPLGANSAVWQDAILRGFEVWTGQIAATVTEVPDNGDPLGTAGATQGDYRFGDIRVATVPMANDTFALSVPHDEVISGTWAGDLLINSASASQFTLDDLFAIAVHEAGHILGLGHSTDPLSPMFSHGIPDSVTPTANDIDDLKKLYGINLEDPGDPDDDPPVPDQGDIFVDAAPLMLSANHQGAIRFSGTGSIQSGSDVDYFRLEPVSDVFEPSDVLTVNVRATSPHGLMPQARIFDTSGVELETTILANSSGEFTIQAKDADPRVGHVVEVTSANGDPLAGGYELVATHGVRVTALDRIARETLQAGAPAQVQMLHISETKLVHFLLEADPVDTQTDVLAWVLIYDSNGELLFQVATRPGQSRSANTLFLPPGNYRIELAAGSPSGDTDAEVDIRLWSRSISLPIGPDLIDTTSTALLPCSDPGADPSYCIVNESNVTDPLLLPLTPTVPIADPVEVVPPPWQDPFEWFWLGYTTPFTPTTSDPIREIRTDTAIAPAPTIDLPSAPGSTSTSTSQAPSTATAVAPPPPTSAAPTVVDPTTVDPSTVAPVVDPAAVDAAIVDPAIVDPAIVDPAIVDPAAVDPAAVDAAIVDPAAVDAAIVDPAVLDPMIARGTGAVDPIPAMLPADPIVPVVPIDATIEPAIAAAEAPRPQVAQSAPLAQAMLPIAASPTEPVVATQRESGSEQPEKSEDHDEQDERDSHRRRARRWLRLSGQQRSADASENETLDAERRLRSQRD